MATLKKLGLALKCPKCEGNQFVNPSEPMCIICGCYPLGHCDDSLNLTPKDVTVYGKPHTAHEKRVLKKTKPNNSPMTKNSQDQKDAMMQVEKNLPAIQRRIRMLIYMDAGTTLENMAEIFGVSRNVIQKDVQFIRNEILKQNSRKKAV